MASDLKVSWTWQASRAARRELTSRFGPVVCRRKESSSDKRLRRLFKGNRVPAV